MRYKIAITGTHGTGKTTKAKELCHTYTADGKIVCMMDEAARDCPLPFGTIQSQEWIWREHKHREASAMEQDVDIIICDRSLLDSLVYYYDIIAVNDQKGINRWRDLYQEAVAWMPTYDQVIRLPLNLEYLQADDPIRSKDIAYARRIDALFDRFVQPYVTPTGEDDI